MSIRDELSKIVFGAKLTKVNNSVEELAEEVHQMTDEQMVKYIKKIAFKISGLGHDSILEMGRHFGVLALPRLAVEYLEHFRLNSWEERSFRLARKVEFEEKDSDGGASRLAVKKYEAIQAAGFPAEDARYSLPMSTMTYVAINTNYRELFYMVSRLLRADHKSGQEIGQILLHTVQEFGFDLEHCDDLITIKGRNPKELFTPFGKVMESASRSFDLQSNHQNPVVQLLQEDCSFPRVSGHRDDEGIVYSITSVLSNVALAQLRRHRIGTLIIEEYHGHGISYEIDLEKGGFSYKEVNYGNALNAPMGLLKAFTWIVNERSLENFLRLRTDSHAQHEIREFAQDLKSKVIK